MSVLQTFQKIPMRKEIKGLFLLLIMCSTAMGQSISEKDFIGVWKVKNIEMDTLNLGLEKAQIEYITKLKEGYGQAIFNIGENKEFSIEIPLEEIKEQLKNACWQFDSSTANITIFDCDEKELDYYDLSWKWPILVSKENNKLQFSIEPLFKFEMEEVPQE